MPLEPGEPSPDHVDGINISECMIGIADTLEIGPSHERQHIAPPDPIGLTIP